MWRPSRGTPGTCLRGQFGPGWGSRGGGGPQGRRRRRARGAGQAGGGDHRRPRRQKAGRCRTRREQRGGGAAGGVGVGAERTVDDTGASSVAARPSWVAEARPPRARNIVNYPVLTWDGSIDSTNFNRFLHSPRVGEKRRCDRRGQPRPSTPAGRPATAREAPAPSRRRGKRSSPMQICARLGRGVVQARVGRRDDARDAPAGLKEPPRRRSPSAGTGPFDDRRASPHPSSPITRAVHVDAKAATRLPPTRRTARRTDAATR